MTEQKTDRVTITETSGEDSLLIFPTEFPIKVMGLTTPDFAEVTGKSHRTLIRQASKPNIPKPVNTHP